MRLEFRICSVGPTYKNILNTENDLLLGFVYIPPKSSKFSSPESFYEIENDLINLLNFDDYIAFIVDFNAKTIESLDYIEPDQNLINALNIVEND